VFDTVKATFGQAIQLGQMKAGRLECTYDSKQNREFFSEASLTGSLAEGDVDVTYDVTHVFASSKTTTTFAASTTHDGTKIGAELKGGALQEVSAERDIGLGDEKISVQPSWQVQAKTARVKLMSKLGGGDKVSAQVDYTPDSKDTNVEVSFDHSFGAGRDMSATVSSGAVDVDYVDSKAEQGATWTASASLPTDAGKMIEEAKLTLKRSWKW